MPEGWFVDAGQAGTVTQGQLSRSALVEYDPFSWEMHEDPYPTYRLLRDQRPAYENADRGFWALSRFDDVQAAARDWGTFSSTAGVDLDDIGDAFGPGYFLNSDPPRHDLLRNVIRKVFAPASIRGRERAIRDQTRELIAAFVERDSCDIAAEFALPLPVHVVSELVGFPHEDCAMLQNWLIEMNARTPGRVQIPARAVEAANGVHSYLTEMVDQRRRTPRDDLLTEIVSAQVEGELLGEEAVGICFLLFLAGLETTSSLITNSLSVLARHPDQRALLAKDPEMIPGGIEELLRYESPIQNLARITTRRVELHDEVIPAGARVLLLFGAANRDERRFERPDRFEVTRDPRRHLAFGEGIHFCLGAPLARLESRVALEELLAVIPEYEVGGPIERLHVHTSRGFTRLPIRFEAYR